jgi:hypothetical protein
MIRSKSERPAHGGTQDNAHGKRDRDAAGGACVRRLIRVRGAVALRVGRVTAGASRRAVACCGSHGGHGRVRGRRGLISQLVRCIMRVRIPRHEYTDRRCCLAARDGSAIESNVSEQTGTLVAALLVRVARTSLVAALQADLLSRLVVRAVAFLVLENCVGELALAHVVASAQRLVDVGT